MTLLDEARRMMGPIDVYCYFCTGSEISGHFDECPMLTTMPRIVKALEAAERLFQPLEYTAEEEALGVPVEQLRVVDAEAYDALASALRGEATA